MATPGSSLSSWTPDQPDCTASLALYCPPFAMQGDAVALWRAASEGAAAAVVRALREQQHDVELQVGACNTIVGPAVDGRVAVQWLLLPTHAPVLAALVAHNCPFAVAARLL